MLETFFPSFVSQTKQVNLQYLELLWLKKNNFCCFCLYFWNVENFSAGHALQRHCYLRLWHIFSQRRPIISTMDYPILSISGRRVSLYFSSKYKVIQVKNTFTHWTGLLSETCALYPPFLQDTSQILQMQMCTIELPY